jgi:DNA-binding MarR family transcriptional regulator
MRLINLLLALVDDDRELPTDLVQMGAELRVAVGRIARRLRQAHGVGEVTLSEASVLKRLESQGAGSPGALAEQEGVRPQAMGTILGSLEQRGLVERRPDATDGRKVLMSVTDTGQAILLDRRSKTTERLAKALGEELTQDERDLLCSALPLLERLAGRL